MSGAYGDQREGVARSEVDRWATTEGLQARHAGSPTDNSQPPRLVPEPSPSYRVGWRDLNRYLAARTVM